MPKRYIPNGPLATDVNGRSRVFTPNRERPDGTIGYDADEVAGIPKAQLKALFRVVDVGTVEEATAAPGETRTSTRKKKPATNKNTGS